jgi:hypothetical protein
MSTLETTLKYYNDNLEIIQERIDTINGLKNNPCLVFLSNDEQEEFEISPMYTLYSKPSLHLSIQKWCYDNDISFAIEMCNAGIVKTHEFRSEVFWARRFKNAEDATAFKLRWSGATKNDIYYDNENIDEDESDEDGGVPF